MTYTAKAQAALEQRAKTDKALAKANENLKDALEEEHQRQLKALAKAEEQRVAAFEDEQSRILKARAKEAEAVSAALEEGAGAISWIYDLATRNGMSDQRLNLSNSQLFIESEISKAKAELAELDKLAQEKGCSSIRFLVKGYSQITNKARKTLEYFRENLPEEVTVEPSGIQRYAGKVGRKKIERYLTETFYPAVESFLESGPADWLKAELYTRWSEASDFNSLVELYGFICDVIEGVTIERPSDLFSVAEWITELGEQLDDRYGSMLPDLVTLAEQNSWQVSRADKEAATGTARAKFDWIFNKYTGATIDEWVVRSLLANEMGSRKNAGFGDFIALKPEVTLDLYLECWWAFEANRENFEYYEDGDELLEKVIDAYKAAGTYGRNVERLNNAPSTPPVAPVSPVYGSDDEEDEEALRSLLELGYL